MGLIAWAVATYLLEIMKPLKTESLIMMLLESFCDIFDSWSATRMYEFYVVSRSLRVKNVFETYFQRVQLILTVIIKSRSCSLQHKSQDRVLDVL